MPFKKIGTVKLGKRCKIDPDVILGYPTGRKIERRVVQIGNDAVLRSGTIIYTGTTIGDALQTGHHVVIREENRIGNGLCIWTNSVIDYGCTLGNNILIHNLVYVCQFTRIEDDVFLAPGVMLANDKYPVNKADLKGPRILRGARVGLNSTVLPGIVVGMNAMVGAGSVVTRDVPDNVVVAGVPARPIKKR